MRAAPSTTSTQGPAASSPPAFCQAPQTRLTARRVCIAWVPFEVRRYTSTTPAAGAATATSDVVAPPIGVNTGAQTPLVIDLT